MANERVGSIDDGLGGTVVTFEFEEFGIGISFLESKDILDVGSTEGVDGLCIISYHADMVVWFRQSLDNEVLRIVGILVLIYQDISEVVLVFAQHVLVLLKEGVGHEEQIVEIHGVAGFQPAVVFHIDT